MPVPLTAVRRLTAVTAPAAAVRRTCGSPQAVAPHGPARCLIVSWSARAVVAEVAPAGRATRWAAPAAMAAGLPAPTAATPSMVATMGFRPRAPPNRRVGPGDSTLAGTIPAPMPTIRALAVTAPMAP